MTQIRARTPTPSRPDQGPAPRLEPKASVRLTGRGAIAALFALCFGTQLIAAWTGWGTLAGAAFVCGCGAVTYYTRIPSAARNVPGAVSSCAHADPAKNSSGGATTTARRPLVLV